MARRHTLLLEQVKARAEQLVTDFEILWFKTSSKSGPKPAEIVLLVLYSRFSIVLAVITLTAAT